MESGLPPKRRKSSVNVPLVAGGIILGTVIAAVLLVAVVWLTPNPVSDALKMPLYWNHEVSGKRRIQARDYPGAEREYAAMIRLRPDLPYGYLLHGNVALRRHEYQVAINDYTTGLRQRSTHSMRGHLRNNLCLASLRAKQYPQAITAANDMLREGEGDPVKAYQMRGDAEGRAGDYSHAVADLVHTTELDPNRPLSWTNRGWWEYKAGMLPQSVQSSRKALSLKPTDLYARFNLGLSYAVLGREAEAREAYQTALKTAPEQNRRAAAKELGEAISRYPASAPLLREAIQWIRNAPPSAATDTVSPAP